MNTFIYMVRHAESPYIPGAERTRGLSEKGKSDVRKVTEILQGERIDVAVSSPYVRAILTVEESGDQLGLEVKTYEDLRERCFSGEDYILRDEHFMSSVKQMFQDPDFALPGGESNTDCQQRAVSALKDILNKYEGKKVVLGTHGNVMTMMMNHFDSKYGWNFFKQTSKPDIYRMAFEGLELREVVRLWREEASNKTEK